MPTIQFFQRDFSSTLIDSTRWTVERLRWKAVGGCWDGAIRAESARSALAQSSAAALWGLARLLRCGVEISGEGGAAWWGYVNAVTICAGGQTCVVTLDTLANRVRAKYTRITPASSLGEEAWTGWHEDAESIAAWGKKEWVLDLGSVTAAEAEAAAEAALRGACQPGLSAGTSSEEGNWARLDLKGWWRALDWETYAEPRGWEGHRAGGSAVNLGADGALQQMRQSITVGTAEGWRLKEVWLRAARAAAEDSLRLVVSSGGVPLATADLPASAVPDALGWLRFSLPGGGITLTGNAGYTLHVQRTGGIDPDRYYRVGVDGGAGDTPGALVVWNGSAWVALSPDADMSFWLVGVEDTLAQFRRAAAGQFVRAVIVEGGEGADGVLYRDGSRTRLREAESLLAGLGLLADTGSDRAVRARGKPSMARARWRVGAGGALLHKDGRPAGLAADPAGEWAELGELAEPGAGMRAVWLDSVVWDGERLKVGE